MKKLNLSEFESARTFRIKIKGLTPYFQNKLDIEAIHNPEKKSKQKNFEPEKEVKKCLYMNGKGVFVPERHIKSALIKSATDFRWEGKKTYKDLIQMSSFVQPEEIPFKAKWKTDIRPEWIRVVGQRIPKPTARPRFDDWDLTFELAVLDERIPDEMVEKIVEGAGLRYGVGDMHKRGFGKYKVLSFAKI